MSKYLKLGKTIRHNIKCYNIEILNIIDKKLMDLKKWIKQNNAEYSQDYDKIKAQIKVLKELKQKINQKLKEVIK